MACIYCGSANSPQGREHVIPQALGMFEHNWTLDCVCDGCNHYFSRELDLPLTRDGLEGYLRLMHGLKPPTGAAQLLNRRSIANVTEKGHYEGAHAILHPSHDGTQLEPRPKPEVGYGPTDDEPFTWVLEEDLNEQSAKPMKVPGLKIRILAQTEDGLIRLRERLAELGVIFNEEGRLNESITNAKKGIEIEHSFKVDITIFRAVAKIAFNYAAKVLGEEFMQRSDFDLARRFIRFGDKPPTVLAGVSLKPILKDDRSSARQTRGHLCTLGWKGQEILFSQVSPFNELTYRIILCPAFRGIWHPIASGHLFDPFAHTITPLTSARFIQT
jgi:hypothetical protein